MLGRSRALVPPVVCPAARHSWRIAGCLTGMPISRAPTLAPPCVWLVALAVRAWRFAPDGPPSQVPQPAKGQDQLRRRPRARERSRPEPDRYARLRLAPLTRCATLSSAARCRSSARKSKATSPVDEDCAGLDTAMETTATAASAGAEYKSCLHRDCAKLRWDTAPPSSCVVVRLPVRRGLSVVACLAWRCAP